MRRVLIWSLATLLAVAAILTTLAFTYFWRSPAYYLDVAPAPGESRMIRLRDYRTGHPNPYVYEVGDVLVFGSEHSWDPAHPQVAEIERQWRAFRPTVALVEGRLGFLAPGFMDPVRTFGEMGKVAALAKADDVPLYSWDVPIDRIAAEVAAAFPAERVAMYLVLRPYFGAQRHGPPEDPDRFVAGYLDRATVPALSGTITSVADIDRIWRRDFPGAPDWRTLSDETPLPGYLKELAAAADDPRTLHLLRLIHTLTTKGERVFAICGSAHAVQIEPALR